MSTQTITYDDRNTPALQYSGTWFLTGTWSDAAGDSGTLSSTNDLSAYVSFTFPTAAISFTYYGMLRSRGGQYGVCIDCDPTSSSAVFTSVNGFDASDKGDSAPVALYSHTFSSPGVHVITMRNEADSRGTPAGNSQLTLDRIVLQVAVPATTTTTQKAAVNPSPTTTSTTTSTSTTSSSSTGSSSTSSTSTRSSTSTSASTASGTNSSATSSGTATNTGVSVVTGISANILPSSSSATTSGTVLAGSVPSASPGATGEASPASHTGSIIGAVVGSLVVILCILLVAFCLRRRRRRSAAAAAAALRTKSPAPRRPSPPSNYVQPFIDPAPTAATSSAPLSESEKSSAMPITTSRSSMGSIEKRRSHQRGPSALYSPSSSSSVHPSVSSPSTREHDAGPLSAYREEEEDFPPPQYSQLYST